MAIAEGPAHCTNNNCLSNLYDLVSLQIDENDNWLRPIYPRYEAQLTPAKPFLVPSFDNEVVEILPSTKQNRRINFDENVHIMEIENRFQMMMQEDQIEEDDEVSYEIEIVEGGQTDDADFYLEMIDGEIFYVFETEDDISVEEVESDADNSDQSSENSSETDYDSHPENPIQLDIGGMLAPNLMDLQSSIRSNGTEPDLACSAENSVAVQEDQTTDICEMHLPLQSEDSMTDFRVYDPSTMVCSKSSDHNIDKTDVISTQVPIYTVVDVKDSSYSLSVNDTPCSADDSLCMSPSHNVRSILKASPLSPKVETPKKAKKDKKIQKDGKKSRTFTKTYVRADDFDGEHRVYSWEKPAWASESKLRSTGKGDAILQGANLAQPITDTKQIFNTGKVKWEKPDWATDEEDEKEGLRHSNDDAGAKEELIRKIQENGLNLPSKRKGGRRLKITLNGSSLQEGSDIVKPITKATVIKKPSNVNSIANPKILRATPGGSKVKEGLSLEAPTTQATTLKKYTFEKPSWTQLKLHSTQAGDILKKGGDVALAITPATAAQNCFSKPDWKAKRGIGRQVSESVFSLQSKKTDYTWEKPAWTNGLNLRKTVKGTEVRAGKGDLAKPITNLPHIKDLERNEIVTDIEQTEYCTQTDTSDPTTGATEGGEPSTSGKDLVERSSSEELELYGKLRSRSSADMPSVQRSKSLD